MVMEDFIMAVNKLTPREMEAAIIYLNLRLDHERAKILAREKP
jgi:hypothetical protein